MNWELLKPTLWYQCDSCCQLFKFHNQFITHVMQTHYPHRIKTSTEERQPKGFAASAIPNTHESVASSQEAAILPEVVVTLDEEVKDDEEGKHQSEFQYVQIVRTANTEDLFQTAEFNQAQIDGTATVADGLRSAGSKQQQTWKCGECNAVYCDSEEYKSHMMSIHEKVIEISKDGTNKIKRQLCPHCNKWQTQLARHIRRAHTSERPFACDSCSRKYSEKYALDSHIRKVHKKTNTKC